MPEDFRDLIDATARQTEAVVAHTAATITHTKQLSTLNGKLDKLLEQARVREKAYFGLILFLIIAMLTMIGVKMDVPTL